MGWEEGRIKMINSGTQQAILTVTLVAKLRLASQLESALREGGAGSGDITSIAPPLPELYQVAAFL